LERQFQDKTTKENIKACLSHYVLKCTIKRISKKRKSVLTCMYFLGFNHISDKHLERFFFLPESRFYSEEPKCVPSPFLYVMNVYNSILTLGLEW
jgi:hypothetical protein